ncbi:MAG: glycosyltransferase [Bacteroidales bacterium]|nr:glycosyltransferase [Bacteroidales bacterium]
MPTLRIAIPAMDELDYLPVTLDALSKQDTRLPFEVYVCVNQPDEYWNHPERQTVCKNNQKLLEFLHDYKSLTLHILDFASPGLGWKGKKTGVGFARKVLFERILSECDPKDIIVSLDADTTFGPYYLQSVADRFERNPEMTALSVPYYHPLNGGDEIRDKALLRYEIYMRNYAVNLLKISSPYGFTALGSAIAMRACSLKKIGNITPYQSGEDFYLVQKFCKMGGLSLFNTECVYPAGRYSDRVPFGTGPAMKLGAEGIWDSYPIYHFSFFTSIQEAYGKLRELYENKISVMENDFLRFLQKENQKPDIWQDIRENVSDFQHFVKAFHQKADGLRILQFVRAKQQQQPDLERNALYDNFHFWMPEKCPDWLMPSQHWHQYTLEQLNTLRDLLFNEEAQMRTDYG